jgi:hypothetical protein
MEGVRKNFNAASAAMQYRDRVLAISPFPYSTRFSIAVNLLRLAPAAIGIAQYFSSTKP